MPQLVAVDHDPFSDAPTSGPTLVPVDHDPFGDGAPAGASAQDDGMLARFGRTIGDANLSVIRGVPFLDRALAGIGSLGSGRSYDEELANVRGYEHQLDEQRPVLSTAGQMAGAMVGPVGALGALTRAGGSAIGRMGVGALAGAVQGGAQGASESPDLTNLPEVADRAAKAAALGAGVGAVAPAITTGLQRAVTPFSAAPGRQAFVDTLTQEGVPVTAGQRTGSKPLMWAESTLGDMPFVGDRAAAVTQDQKDAFTGAALRRMGVDATAATPDVLRAGTDRIGQVFDDLSARNTLRFDPQFAQDLSRVVSDYGNVLPSQQRGMVMNVIQDLANQGGQLPGAMYQQTRSQLSKQADAMANSDPAFSRTLGGIRDALDGAMDRSISPADQAAWAEARGQWRNWKVIEKAATGAGSDPAQGVISAPALRNAVTAQNRGAYARGYGDLADLARAGAAVMTPLPNSGTAPRAAMQSLFTGGGLAAGGVQGAIAGTAIPAIAGRAIMSRPGQAYLGNQLLAAEHPTLDAGMDALVRTIMAYPTNEAVRPR